jgi:L-ascorbate metabolism protein UlaG (beta-lactamase superfamily)
VTIFRSDAWGRSAPTLHQLAARGSSTFVVAARGARLLRFQRIESVYELDWGESLAIYGYTIHCVPALHFSARGILDRTKTLWCGYVIEYPESLVYFAGDTGFGSHFDQIREKFGSPQLALLPIGAYEPRWFMSPVHMSPEEAVRAHTILGAKTSIAIHHGVFVANFPEFRHMR